MTNRSYVAPSPPPYLYALAGTILLVIGGMLFINREESPDTFLTLAVVVTAPGLYFLIAGAIARGIALASPSVASEYDVSREA
ncbi:hypothetical protein [Nocardioides speluncae]|uniref:hypothetical protein n=1 Tax=Nocardioides speluncae TaxID=2670337 RepID=UPI000D689654|nr:hypothetical protein [Nocardioides speluncae]